MLTWLFGRLTGALWAYQWFRLLSLKIVRHSPRRFSVWWSVNTPLALSLHHMFLQQGDFEMASSMVRDFGSLPGAWSFRGD